MKIRRLRDEGEVAVLRDEGDSTVQHNATQHGYVQLRGRIRCEMKDKDRKKKVLIPGKRE